MNSGNKEQFQASQVEMNQDKLGLIWTSLDKFIQVSRS